MQPNRILAQMVRRPAFSPFTASCSAGLPRPLQRELATPRATGDRRHRSIPRGGAAPPRRYPPARRTTAAPLGAVVAPSRPRRVARRHPRRPTALRGGVAALRQSAGAGCDKQLAGSAGGHPVSRAPCAALTWPLLLGECLRF